MVKDQNTLKSRRHTGQKNILITGGAGFIGSNLTHHHIAEGNNVTVLDDLTTGTQKNLDAFLKNPHFNFVQADIGSCEKLPDLLEWSDQVYHLAASVGNTHVLNHPFSTLTNNVFSCQRLLELAAKHNPTVRVIVASSSEVYGFSLSEFLSENDILCLSPPHEVRSEYAISKLLDESFSQIYFKKYNLPVTAVRLFNTIGPNQSAHYGMVVPRLTKQAISEEPLTVIGDGSHKRCFLDVRDLVIMLDELAANKNSAGKTINVGNDNEISIEELAELIIDLSNSHSRIAHVEASEVYGYNFSDIHRRKPNLKMLHSYINHRPKWTIRETVASLIKEFRDNKSKK